MSHIILTGGTGLLGGYLIRDLLHQGHSLAVLARGNRLESAAERVESVVRYWETSCGPLPRPRVLEGNITHAGLGLSEADQQWAADHCSAVIHSAASLKFQPSGDEPWNSNLNGTRNIVEFCESFRVPRLFYISTAYVCGRVNSVAWETPISGDTEPRNVYEASKRQAEQLVLNSELPEPPTILRPSIIVGDSQTGYTSTFHGPYLPLRLALSMLSPAVSGTGIRLALDPLRILKMMGLEGHERKNLIPVDWVSRAITQVVGTPVLHGQIYHLTADESVTVRTLTRTTIDLLNEFFDFDVEDTVEFDAEMEQYFTSQMTVYREYWADDPQFDGTNRDLAMPHDPPPAVDENMLRTLFQYVVEFEQQQRAAVTG